ncbi:MAG: hypothetical protein LUD39_02660 [Opitutae bacterium]|nr:hypothetical protein [Opitutae bacterium]MCD8298646.1 hypothetical protein [Opitutae bacterium]
MKNCASTFLLLCVLLAGCSDKELEAEYQVLSSNYEASQGEVVKLRTQLAKKQEELAAKDLEVTTATKEVERQEAKISELKAQLETVLQELKESSEELSRLAAELAKEKELTATQVAESEQKALKESEVARISEIFSKAFCEEEFVYSRTVGGEIIAASPQARIGGGGAVIRSPEVKIRKSLKFNSAKVTNILYDLRTLQLLVEIDASSTFTMSVGDLFWDMQLKVKFFDEDGVLIGTSSKGIEKIQKGVARERWNIKIPIGIERTREISDVEIEFTYRDQNGERSFESKKRK